MWTSFKRQLLSIGGQFLLIALAASLLLVLNVLYDNHRTLNAALIENVKTSVAQNSRLLNLTVSTHSSKKGLETVKIFFDEMIDPQAKNGLTYVAIGDASGKVILSTQKINGSLPAPNQLEDIEIASANGVVHVRNALLLPDSEVGFLQYGFSTENIIEATSAQHQNALMRTFLVIGATFCVIVWIGSNVTQRFTQMIDSSEKIVKGDLSQRIQIGGQDELSRMATQFNCVVDALETKIDEITELNRSLENRVRIRTWELEHSKKELEANLRQLKEAQRQLVNAEKLAGLGSLVAGIAHELNTPIGNAYTVSTTVTEKVGEFDKEFSAGALKRSSLARFNSEMLEASDLLNKNLRRATELITSFKTVAVDQASENRRKFDLLKTVEELAVTLRVQLRKRKIEFLVEIAPGIELDSYPGPLMQVISNLFNNAVIHGFEHRESGQIKIMAHRSEQVEDECIEIHFIDNGVGIQPRIVDKIFDPFFTTKFGQGGSGLGLNICYNIVNGVLGGQIAAHSVVGIGTRFTLVLPLVVSESKLSTKNTRQV